MRAIRLWRGQEMAGRAFARRKMLALWRMAGEAQATIGDEPRDRRLPMAGVA
jgi:hypothetical protein